MSMAAGRIACTGCDFEGFLQYRPVTVVYCFDDGTEVEASREFAWCMDCDGIRDVEARSSAVAPLQVQLAALRTVTAGRGYRLKRWFSDLTKEKPHEVEADIARVEGHIKLALRKGERCRCLRCGSLATHSLAGFVHRCGGTLRPEPSDPDAPRFSYRPETICVDEDGRLLRAE